MAIVQISQIQLRRGLQQDLPQLASAEMGWSVDTRRLFIGNGTFEEGAPSEGVTEILTEYSDILSLFSTYTFKGLSAGFQVVTGPDSLHPVVRSLQDKLDDYVSVKDFGAVGNGADDDTAAIQRAIDRVYATNQSQLLSGYHRTVHFPSGQYKISSPLLIPPYSRLQGEGKRTTVITGSHAGPLAVFVDSFGQTSTAYGNTDQSGNAPEVAEYHFSDMEFLHTSPTYNQSCVVIDGCWTAVFNRVCFRGLTKWAQPDSVARSNGLDYYTSDRGSGIAGVWIRNASQFQAVRNVSFTQCDFLDINYGIEISDEALGTSLQTCYFDHNYHNIVVGVTNPGGYHSFGTAVVDSYFRYSAAEAIITGTKGYNVTSTSNIFTASGLGDWEADSAVVNTTGLAMSPVIKFGSSNCFSIADVIQRTDDDYALFPNIDVQSFDCYVVGQDTGLIDGRLTDGRGHTTTLADSAVFVTAGLKYIPANYNNISMFYTVNHNSQQRTGTFTASRVGSTYIFDDEYNETGETGVVFKVNPSSGDIQYTSTVSGNPAQLTYNLKFLTA
jgi:hypothetical protein